MAMSIYVREFNGLAVTASPENYDRMDPANKKLWKSVPDHVEDGWRKVNGVWTAPPEIPAEAPADYYIAKVTFERRFADPAFAVLDALRITVRNRPADWATTEDQNWVGLRPFVRPLCDYDAADRINVLDPALGALLRALQDSRQLFGQDPEVAETVIGAILTPARLSGEPLP